MESTNKKKKWITMLLTMIMSVALLLGATACNDKNDGNTDIIVEDNNPDVVVPEGDDGDGGADLDVDVDVESEAPASPSASPSAS